MRMEGLFRILCLFYCATLECRKEQRSIIKACVSWGYEPVQTHNALRAVWGDHTLSMTQVRHWIRVFWADPTRSVSDVKRPGRPRSVHTAEWILTVDHALDFERHVTSCQLGSQLHMSHTSILKVLHKDLGMKKIAPRFVLRKLSQELVAECLDMSTRNLARISEDRELLKKIVATDETWCYTYDPWSKQADMQWTRPEEPRPSKALRGHSQKKLLLILFFDAGGIISKEFIEGTVNSEIYIQALRNMREAMRRKRPHLWETRDFHLLQDGASPHTSDDLTTCSL